MRRALTLLAITTFVLASYLGFWPVPIEAVRWTAPPAPGYVGVFAENHELSKLNLIPLGAESGPEHVVLGPDGKLYVAVTSGRLLRMNPDGTGQEVFADSGSRLLGFDFDAAGDIIAADVVKGLVSISRDGKVSVLADRVAGEPILFADAVVVAQSGKVYLSDASRRFAPPKWGGVFEAAVLDMHEQSSTGRVLEYDPSTRSIRVVARGLSFANGVALTVDERHLFVCETGRFRVWKLDVTATELDVAEQSGQASVVLDNLPGYPDNLMRGTDGTLWLGLVAPRNADADGMADKPFLRELTLRLPRALWPIPRAYGHVLQFAEDGRVLASLQDPTGSYPQTTGLTETPDRLYVQNLHLRVLGWRAR